MRTYLSICVISAILCSAVAAPSSGFRRKSSVKIVGGEEAAQGEFPYLVSVQLVSKIGEDNQHTCGGTLYNMSRVITAASCVPTAIPSNYLIVAGAHTMREAILGQQQYRMISHITLHPNYNPFDDIIHDDIAVVDLESPFEPSATVQELPMARRYVQYTDVCVIAGWGASNYNGNFSDTILKGDVAVHPKSYCAAAYPGEYDSNMQICANGVNSQGQLVDACGGDLGGPLVCKNTDGTKYLAGVSSWGYFCGSVEQPGVYMEVSKYRAWLDSVIFEGEEPTTTAPATTTRAASSQTTKKSYVVVADGDNGDAAAADQVDNKPVHQRPCGTASKK